MKSTFQKKEDNVLRIWAVLQAYDKEDKIYYQVLPYNLRGTIKCHFKFYNGFKTLIPFLFKCKLTKERADRLANKLK